MLAPSAITLRRPSCESDLILTRIESEPPFYSGLSTSDSIQSAPLYDCWAFNCDDIAPADLRVDGTGDHSHLTKQRNGSLSLTTCGPDPRGRYWQRRSVPRICEDTSGSGPGGLGQGIDLAGPGGGGGGFRRASLTLRRSIDSLLCSLTSPKKSINQTGLTIEVIQESPLCRRRSRLRQRGKSLDKVHEDFEDDYFAQSNLSLSLNLVSLKDGRLCADILIDELEEVPSGHVTIRVRNFNLDVSLSSAEKACFRQPGEPCYRGSVSLPIYVNPSTLQFRVDESKNVVHLEGRIKGCCTRIGSSLSAMELSSQAGLSAPRVSAALAGAVM